MDLTVAANLTEAGIDPTFKTRPHPIVGIDVDAEGRVQPAGDTVLVIAGDKTTRVSLKKISELFAGTRTPPSFRSGPTEAYMRFFSTLEFTVVMCCRAMVRPEYDAEIERLYTLLRRRPDGHDANPLFSYMQAAARLYMSAFDVSRAELEAVCSRLSRSAHHMATGPTSAAYFDMVDESVEA